MYVEPNSPLSLDVRKAENAVSIKNAMSHGVRVLQTTCDQRYFDLINEALSSQESHQMEIHVKFRSKDVVSCEISDLVSKSLIGLKAKCLDVVVLNTPDLLAPEILEPLSCLRKKEKLIHIGLTHVNGKQLKFVLDKGFAISYVYVEFNPLYWDRPLYDYCREKDISIAGLCLWNNKILKNKRLVKLAKKLGKSVEQIIIRWCLQKDVMPITKCLCDDSDFMLTQKQVKSIDSLNTKKPGYNWQAKISDELMNRSNRWMA